jgi:hypothetical protein
LIIGHEEAANGILYFPVVSSCQELLATDGAFGYDHAVLMIIITITNVDYNDRCAPQALQRLVIAGTLHLTPTSAAAVAAEAAAVVAAAAAATATASAAASAVAAATAEVAPTVNGSTAPPDGGSGGGSGNMNGPATAPAPTTRVVAPEAGVGGAAAAGVAGIALAAAAAAAGAPSVAAGVAGESCGSSSGALEGSGVLQLSHVMDYDERKFGCSGPFDCVLLDINATR